MRWDLRHGREVVSRGQRKGRIPVEGELEDRFFARQKTSAVWGSENVRCWD